MAIRIRQRIVAALLGALCMATCPQVPAALAEPAAQAEAEVGVALEYLVRDARGTWAGSWTGDRAVIDSNAGITGVRIRLAGAGDEQYDVRYRARTADGTWLEWASDGESLATADLSPLKDLQVAVADDGQGTPFSGDGDSIAFDDTDGFSPLSAQAYTWKRLAGNTRYDTMAAIVEEGFSSSDWVVVASGKNFPDALSACALAGALKCPLVLTTPDALSPQANAQIKRLGAKKAYLMGGEAAVGSTVESALASAGVATTRVYGSDRARSSVEAMRTLRGINASSHTVIVASGATYYDALSIAPWAYQTVSPIVLVKPDGTLPDEAVDAIKNDTAITEVLVVGGTDVVKPNIELQLAGNYKYTRIAGKDRYDTSRDIAEWEATQGFSWSRPAVASARDFPDALAGGPLCGKGKQLLLIASSATNSTLATLRNHKDEVSNGYILGGKSAVSFDDPLAVPDADDPMVAKAQDYSSPTGWLILVDCTLNRLSVFSGSQGNWVRTGVWPVGTGKLDTPTVKGIFSVGDRGYSFGDGHHTCYYWTQIYGAYLFHSVLYYPGTFEVRDGRLGQNVSMGCVRMEIQNAKWIHDTIPYGTTIVTF